MRKGLAPFSVSHIFRPACTHFLKTQNKRFATGKTTILFLLSLAANAAWPPRKGVTP
jgi:hypothetical protein